MSDLAHFKLLTKADVAAIFGVCTKTVDNYIREDRLPAPVAFASREYWHPDDFKAFLDRTFRRSTPPPEGDDAAGPCVGSPPTHATLAASAPAPTNERMPRDSNPVVRQRARQEAKLRTLNTGG